MKYTLPQIFWRLAVALPIVIPLFLAGLVCRILAHLLVALNQGSSWSTAMIMDRLFERSEKRDV